jgi:hypothetical protein
MTPGLLPQLYSELTAISATTVSNFAALHCDIYMRVASTADSVSAKSVKQKINCYLLGYIVGI